MYLIQSLCKILDLLRIHTGLGFTHLAHVFSAMVVKNQRSRVKKLDFYP
jgi:hypothetical protein